MPRVQRTALAGKDLLDIGRYIAQESGSREVALRFLDQIAVRAALYGGQPEMGERCPDLGESVRRFVVGNYVVFYQPMADGIEILRVLHGSRDVPSAWRDRYRK